MMASAGLYNDNDLWSHVALFKRPRKNSGGMLKMTAQVRPSITTRSLSKDKSATNFG